MKYLGTLVFTGFIFISSINISAQEQFKRKYNTIAQLLQANQLTHKEKSYLYLFVHPSYQVFDYSSSRDFQRSSIYTGTYEEDDSFSKKIADTLWGYDLNSVGHVQFAWYCNSRNDVYTGATGYTGEEDDQVSKMIDQGWGLTAMLSDFNDSSFEPEYYVTEDLETSWHNEEGYFWMAVEVDKSQCFNATFFIEDFIQKSPSVFSFNRDPEKFEGGVCSSVAASFFRHAKTKYQRLIEATHRSLRIPKKVLGNIPSAKLPKDVSLPKFVESLEEKKVEKINLILRPIEFHPHRNYENFNFYDPELMAYMIRRLEAEYIGGRSKMMGRKVIELNDKQNFSRKNTGYRKRKYSTNYVEVSHKTDSSYKEVFETVRQFKRDNPELRFIAKVSKVDQASLSKKN